MRRKHYNARMPSPQTLAVTREKKNESADFAEFLFFASQVLY
jgi:hypothetical protein